MEYTLNNNIISRLLRLADLAMDRLENGPAFAHLSVLINIVPDLKDSIKQKFITCLCYYGKELEDDECYSDIFNCYENALKLFPNNEILLNNLGSHLIRLGYNEEGQNFVMKALDINEFYLPAITNIQIVNSRFVERWHYRMLNDSKRNLAYKKAIGNRINQGHKTVLDIGCGSLILSLYAAEYPVDRIYACDYSKIMSKIASEVLTRNNLHNLIKIFNMNSNDLCIPDNIDERVSLVVTETMDAGLFGEHILTTLKHAWDKLLLPPKSNVNPELPHGCVIPHHAKVYAVPIQCSYVRKRNLFYGKEQLYFKQLNLCSTTNEPYDCEKLSQLPGGYIFLAAPQVVMDINFNDPSQINKLLNTQNVNIKSMKYSITQSGNVDAIISWFVVNLTEDISINTIDEKNENCCWEQALFVSKSNRRVEQGDELCVLHNWEDDHYVLKIDDEISNPKFIPLDKEIIAFLNDINQVEGYIKAAKQWYKNNKSLKNIRILDTCPFPIFGIEILSLATSTNNYIDIEIYYIDTNLTEIIENQMYTEKMLKPNGIILPEKISVKCQLVNSKWLPHVSKVNENNNSCNPLIRDLINTYSVNHHLDVFRHLVTDICLSDCKTCLTLLPKQLSQEMSLLKSIPIIANGKLNTILYYFKIFIYNNCNVSTANENSYLNQCAFLIENAINVYSGNEVKINTMINNGHLLLTVDKK
ncbi:protein arginine N-methyltransferase 9-like [Melanaphis sacchari]|uniref:protein arginine N-methyltransferase 9-like n=1 Tax=Melanaphis sacchari TaxID=742174 RepID=UPI000DC13318|nr:protein arginine N-methyltransferase 9-like [Melanaphis sacchari]